MTTKGAVDLTSLHVVLNGNASPHPPPKTHVSSRLLQSIAISNTSTYVPVDTPSKSITYLTLTSAFTPGDLTITAGNATFTYVLPAVQTGRYVTTKPFHPSLKLYLLVSPSPSALRLIPWCMVLISPLLQVTFNISGSLCPDGVEMRSPPIILLMGSLTPEVTGTLKTARARARMTGLAGFMGPTRRVCLPSPRRSLTRHRVFKVVMTFSHSLDWVSKDSTSYSYPKSIYPGSYICRLSMTLLNIFLIDVQINKHLIPMMTKRAMGCSQMDHISLPLLTLPTRTCHGIQQPRRNGSRA